MNSSDIDSTLISCVFFMALLDNFLVMHGRKPFEGTRCVLAGLIAA
ncbi:MAG: hypothetical protein O2971_17930 [Proteobacteria bacterium]|nr:hypothetical protein [Pseudomonadota bacterium]